MKLHSKDSALRLALAELGAVTLWVATSLFLFFATKSTLLHSLSPSLRHFPPFQVFLSGLVIVMAIWEVLGLSLGSPFNPSVTLSQAIARKLTPLDATIMIIAQFSGHILGVILVRALAWYAFSEIVEDEFSPPQPHESLSYAAAMVIEAVITALLCAAALVMDDALPKSATVKKFSIMSTLIVAILAIFGEWTGSCMNPAMSFALSLLESHWSAHGVYWIGPVCGALFAGFWYQLRASKDSALRRARWKRYAQSHYSVHTRSVKVPRTSRIGSVDEGLGWTTQCIVVVVVIPTICSCFLFHSENTECLHYRVDTFCLDTSFVPSSKFHARCSTSWLAKL